MPRTWRSECCSGLSLQALIVDVYFCGDGRQSHRIHTSAYSVYSQGFVLVQKACLLLGAISHCVIGRKQCPSPCEG